MQIATVHVHIGTVHMQIPTVQVQIGTVHMQIPTVQVQIGTVHLPIQKGICPPAACASAARPRRVKKKTQKSRP